VNLLLGDTPAPLDALPPSVPPAVRRAVGRALEKNADRRYARAADFGSELHIAALELRLDEPTIVADGPATLLADGPATLLVGGTPALRAGVTPSRLAQRDQGLTLRAQPLDSAPPLDLPLAVPAPLDEDRRAAPRARRLASVLTAAVLLALVLAAAVMWSGSRGGRVADAPPPPTPKPAAASPGVDQAPSAAAGTPAPQEAAKAEVGSPSVVEGGLDTPVRAPAKAPVNTVTVVVRGSYPFEVVTREGTSPASDRHELTVIAGQTIRLRSPEVFLDRGVALPARAGRQGLSAPGLGTLEVRTTSALESCLVAIEGREVDYPTGLRVSIVAGAHLVSLVGCPDGQTRQQPVRVEAGGLTQVRFR